jgi:hypothetical protein
MKQESDKAKPAVNYDKVITIEFSNGTQPTMRQLKLGDSISWKIDYCKWNLDGKMSMDAEVYADESKAQTRYDYRHTYWKVANELKPRYLQYDEKTFASAVTYIDHVVDKVIAKAKSK